MSSYQQVTLTQFTTVVRNRLGPTAFWTDDEIRQFTNAAMRTWNALTGFWKTRITFPTSANFPYYVLPATLVFGAHVEANGVPITQGSVFNWDQADPNWMLSRGVPTEWAPVGLAIIALRPIPPTSAITILVDGVSVTPTLVNGTDYVNIGQEEFKVLIDYITHVLVFKEGGAEFQSTLPAYKGFLEAAGIRNEKLRASAFYRRAMGLDRDMQSKPWRRKSVDVPVGVR